MTRFITVDEKAGENRAVLWEESGDGFRVVGHYPGREDVPGHDEVQAWSFDVPTTLAAGGPANESRQPLVDARGAPLWEGARIRFRLPSTYVNTYEDGGTFGRANRYGGHTFVSDRAHPNWGPRGEWSSQGRERYSAGGEYNHKGPLKGYNQLAKGLGDPFEHGVTGTFVVLDEDPRNACTLTHDPSAAPTP